MDINLNRLARQLWPYLQPLIEPMLRRTGTTTTGTGGGVVGGAPSPHALNSAHHAGTLGDAQAPQFLKTNGSRQLTGNLGVAPGVTIDGVDLSAHAANADAHHNRQHSVTSTADHTASGLTAGQVLRASAPTAFAWAQLQHSDLGGVTANQHHNQVHGITGTDHTVTGDQYDLVGLSAANALGLLASANDVGTSPALRFLRSTGSGGLTLATLALAGNLSFTGARSVTSNSTNNLTLAPGGDLVLDPTGKVQLPDAQEIRTTNFSDLVTGITGMRLFDRGSNYRQLTLGALKIDELYARVFVADETRIDRGEEYWSKSFGIVEGDFAAPAKGTDVLVTFENSPAFSGDLFSNGDWLLFRIINLAAGSVIAKFWFEVRFRSVPTGGDPTGTQRWQLRRQQGGDTGTIIKRGSVALNTGQVGQGWVHLSALKQDQGPFIQVGKQTVAGAYDTAPLFANYVRMGNLNGIGGISSDTWGFAAAKNLATSIGSGFEGFVLDPDNGMRQYNVATYLYNGSSLAVALDADGIRVTAPTGAQPDYLADDPIDYQVNQYSLVTSSGTPFGALRGAYNQPLTPDRYEVDLVAVAPTSTTHARLRLQALRFDGIYALGGYPPSIEMLEGGQTYGSKMTIQANELNLSGYNAVNISGALTALNVSRLRSGTTGSMYDDTAAGIGVPAFPIAFLLIPNATGAAAILGVARANNSQPVVLSSNGTVTTYNNTDLTGTTGADNSTNISIKAGGIELENRSGAAANWTYILFC